jgi:hypothetical protein
VGLVVLLDCRPFALRVPSEHIAVGIYQIDSCSACASLGKILGAGAPSSICIGGSADTCTYVATRKRDR